MTQTAADVALRATLLLGVSWATASVLEKAGASAARRYAVWLSGFAALALLLPCMWLLPRLPVPILPAQVPFAPQLAAGPPIAGPLVATMDSISFLELIYLAIGVLLLGRIAVATLMIERLWRRAAPLRNARILEQAAAISASLGVRRDIAIRIADREVVPMTWGSVRPRIVLPQEALGWGEERWHSVLLHELGHVYRHDSLSRLAVEAICALYWPHPGMWLAAGRLRLAQEQACDDLALTHGVPALGYARELLGCASPDHGSRAALAMASTDLEQRLRSVLGNGSRAGAGKTFLGSSALLAAGTASIISVMTPVSAQSAVQSGGAPQLHFGAKADGGGTAAPAVPRAKHASPIVAPSASSKYQASTAAVASEALTGDHDPRLAQYDQDVIAYSAAVERYDGELEAYRAANDDYGRRLEAYNRRMSEIGPGPPPEVLIPTAPTAPTAPSAPTAPTVPTTPPEPVRP